MRRACPCAGRTTNWRRAPEPRASAMPPELKPRFNVWLEVDEKVALSRWRVQLLEAVARTGSISAAAESMDIQYRLAWKRIREMEERLGLNLVTSTVGGKGGGGTTLTPAAEKLVARFNRMVAAIERCVGAEADSYIKHIWDDL
ncbi:MAG: LysR family transcriptional regulator [Caldilineae bacterium]|nr:MAG: LysR family transcriptional regulator [Caldilineae bacterium]